MTIESLPLILEPEELETVLGNPDLLVIDLCQPALYRAMHVPGAVHVSPAELVSGIPPATGKLAPETQLNALFSRIGLSPEKFVVAYDDEGGGWAGRFIWTLDVIGHRRHAFLNGGIHAWRNEGHPLESGPVTPSAGSYRVSIDRSVIADMDEVLREIGNPATVVWDARSAEEYRGSRPGALRNGHIPGAINLDWLETMDRSRNLRLLGRDTLRGKLGELGISEAEKIITHCQSHHRSGLTYLVGKSLGLPIKAYDGSWSEWGNLPHTPIES